MKNNDVEAVIDDETIEQLVDGQLSGERYREAVRSLERSGDGWRRCAIAFLQEQALKQELRSFARSGLTEILPDDRRSSGAGRDVSTMPSGAESLTSESEHWLRPWNSTVHVMALAACVLIAFGLGWFGGGLRFGAGSANDGNGSGYGSALVDGQSLNPDAVFTDVDMQSGMALVDSDIADSLRELERRGMVRIESTNGLFPVELSDGRPGIMPVQNIRVRPVMYAY